jgi:membrane protease YdiL (CAAX protease family)
MEEIIEMSERTCLNCGAKLAIGARFCSSCGLAQTISKTDESNWQRMLIGLSFFFGLLTIICLVGNFSSNKGIDFLLLMDLLFMVITITGVGMSWNSIKPFLYWKSFKILKVIGYSVLSIILAIVVNVIINWLNKSMFGIETYYYEAFRHLRYAKLITILIIAVQPAIFEELAFRGVIQGGLSRIIEPQQTIYLTAFLFAILHMSFLSLFWLIPFAVLLSYLRNKENTLWYGIIMHFFFNATACFLEFFRLDVL